jgi:AcrR family transcriptional regulator
MSEQTAKILSSARDIYLDEGLQGLSMRKIAARVGVSATALYRHFDNKEAIVAEMLEEGFRIFGNYLYKALSGATPEERMAASGQAYLDFALEQPKYYETIFMSPTEVWTDCPPESHVEGGLATFQFLVDRVQEGMDAGLIRKDDPEDMAITIWAQSHGLVSLYLTGRIDAEEAQFREMFMRHTLRLIEGLR